MRATRQRGGPIASAVLAALLAGGVGSAAGEPRLLDLLLDPAGLPALHEEQEDGPPKMWLPQFRLFDADGRPLWALTLMPRKGDFRRELARRVEERQPLAEGRTLRQEARHFLRRGGLPLNLTTLPPSELTVVEYWTSDCGQCRELTREVDRYFGRASGVAVNILRVYIALE